MSKFGPLIIISTTILLMSCSVRTETTPNVNSERMRNYVMDEKLSSNNYSNINGYIPEEGLVPTAEVAFQVAEPILVQIYGREKIETEKPFSINIENEVWIIEGHLDKELLGGVAYMEIRKSNAEVLKIIHTK